MYEDSPYTADELDTLGSSSNFQAKFRESDVLLAPRSRGDVAIRVNIDELRYILQRLEPKTPAWEEF